MNLLFINPETDLASQHAISYLYFQLLSGVNRVYLCFSFFFGRGLSNKQPEAELIQQVMSCSSPGKHTNLLGCRSISVSGLVSLLVLQSRPTAAQGHSGGCVTPIEAEQGRRSKSLVCLLTKFRKTDIKAIRQKWSTIGLARKAVGSIMLQHLPSLALLQLNFFRYDAIGSS